MLVSVLGVAGLLAALAPPTVAQDNGKDWVWHTDGKRYWRTEECVNLYVTPTTMTIDVVSGDRQEGDSWRMSYVGKHLERVYTREVPRPAPEFAKGHECSWRFRYVGKTTTRESFCSENGVEQPYVYHDHPREHTVRK
jgi:hypothetical protein